MKSILIFATTYFPLVGGAEIALKEITDRLPEMKFDLVCAKIKKDLSSFERIGNVNVYRVGIGHPIDKYLLAILGPLRVWRLRRSKSFDLTWSLMASYGGFAALVYSTIFQRTKLVLTLQEGDPTEHYDKRTGVLSFLHKAIFKRADCVQAISNFLANWSKEMGFKGEPVVIPNGVNFDLFSREESEESKRRLREFLEIKSEDKVLITTSRLSLKNGVDDVIRALSYLPNNWRFVVIGEGEDNQKLMALKEELGVRVDFLGLKPHSELPGYLQVSDVFVRPSLSEGLGNSFLEAMAAGIPVIGTKMGGIPDFLKDGETGVFCEVRNPESIAKAVQRLDNAELRSEIVQNGRKLVKDKYNWNKIVDDMRELFNNVCK